MKNQQEEDRLRYARIRSGERLAEVHGEQFSVYSTKGKKFVMCTHFFNLP